MLLKAGLVAATLVAALQVALAAPEPVLGGTMLAVAIAGLVANLAAFLVLNGGNRNNLNMRSAWLHVLGDIAGFIGAIIAACLPASTTSAP